MQRWGWFAGIAVAWLLLAVASAAEFVFATAVTPHVSDPALVATGAAMTALFLLAMGGIPRREVLARLGVRGIAACAAVGVLATAIAPALVATSRYSDSPPGTVVAFWTLAVWGAVLVVASSAVAKHHVRSALALLAVVGSAGILGNWEQPSSFSLLVVHFNQEVALVVAGVAWVAAILVARRYAQRYGAAPVYTLAGAGGLIGALVWALPSAAWDAGSLIAPSSALPAAAAQALVIALALYLAIHVGPHVPGAALLLGVPLISLLLVVEEATRVYGPRPIIVEPATWAGVTIVACVAAILLPVCAGGDRRTRTARRSVLVAGSVLAGVAAILAVAAAVMPGVEASVRGTTHAGAAFAADFAMRGFQTVGGWLAISVAVLALAANLERIAADRLRSIAALVAGLVAAAAYLHVRYTPLHVWMTWIPPEVQQDYGSEYATIVFTPVPTPVQVAALVAGCAALLLSVVGSSLAGSVDSDDSRGTGGKDR